MHNRCVCCGEIIPEGRQICYICENNTMLDGLKWEGGESVADTGQDQNADRS